MHAGIDHIGRAGLIELDRPPACAGGKAERGGFSGSA
jgi:hypothetical protein